MEKVLLRDPEAQVLLMVPEINLTPQLVEKVQSRFPQFEVVSWNSGMAEGQKPLLGSPAMKAEQEF